QQFDLLLFLCPDLEHLFRDRFRSTEEEYQNLRSRFVTSSESGKHGGRRYMIYVFTEQGIAMLCCVYKERKNFYTLIGFSVDEISRQEIKIRSRKAFNGQKISLY
ncbi:MAG: ORF6N domain-containing protein, partial [Peptostreptococcaceae bacterium]|nr:ORF6N domain-containing protein [Peptostreptococcaceae bacterium]